MDGRLQAARLVYSGLRLGLALVDRSGVGDGVVGDLLEVSAGWSRQAVRR